LECGALRAHLGKKPTQETRSRAVRAADAVSAAREGEAPAEPILDRAKVARQKPRPSDARINYYVAAMK
jgi:hypothetical protein